MSRPVDTSQPAILRGRLALAPMVDSTMPSRAAIRPPLPATRPSLGEAYHQLRVRVGETRSPAARKPTTPARLLAL